MSLRRGNRRRKNTLFPACFFFFSLDAAHGLFYVLTDYIIDYQTFNSIRRSRFSETESRSQASNRLTGHRISSETGVVAHTVASIAAPQSD